MPPFRSILVADDEPSIRHVLSLVLSDKGYDVRAVADGEDALRELSARSFDLVICDVRMPKLDGLALLKRAKSLWPELTFIVISAYGSNDVALEAVAAGAYHYVQKPFKPEEVLLVLRKAEERLRLLRENKRLREGRMGPSPLDRMIGTSEGLRDLVKQIEKLAAVSTTVLITGESGTGKELVAHAIHELSPRAAMPFVAVNCGAIPTGLIESELFGHARGAFTDAHSSKVGLFSEGDGGTVFLDEVGELPTSSQIKLLRVLQEGEIRPLGENKTEKVDIRVIAATLRDLGKLVERGSFREDLYYRLNVVNIRIPPLRERSQDIGILTNHFVERFNRELNRETPVNGVSPEAAALLVGYHWPGNVRELENAIEHAVLLAEGEMIVPQNLPEKLWGREPAPSPIASPENLPRLSLKRAIRELEETYIKGALRRTRGNRTRAAELLEISHRALLYKIKEYGIDPDAEAEKYTPP